MPMAWPVWIAEYICATLFSRIRLRIAGVPIMISCAATRPVPSLDLSSVCEITIGTPAIRNLIRENKVAQMYSAIQTGQAIGMQTLDQNLTQLVQRGLTSSAEARQKAMNKDLFPG